MYKNCSLKVFILLTSYLTMVSSQAFSYQDPKIPYLYGFKCEANEDCGTGPGFTCNLNNGECMCPGPLGKPYIVLVKEKPKCQKIAHVGESCELSVQCEMTAGRLSRCHKNKCECYDTENIEDLDVIMPYAGMCYRSTGIGENCDSDKQCKAFIQPENNVVCFRNSTMNASYCRCIAGQDCEDKIGAATRIEHFLNRTLALLAIVIMNTHFFWL